MADEPSTGPYEPESRLHEAIASFEQARDAGKDPNLQEWLARYPEVTVRLADFFADQEQLQQLAGPLRSEASRAADSTPALGDEPEPFPDIPGYQILDLIGRGGMGVVYRARQLSADRIVALKVIRPEHLEGLSSDERRKAFERFITEAQAAAKLEHENIVNVYDVGEARGRPFYSMRYVVGTSLHDLIQRGPLEGRRAAGYLEQVARAVHEGHRHGILHRDLKPHNVLLEANGDRPLVADFGLAKLLQGGREITATGDVMGTPPYMSPEQAQSSTQLSVGTDVYGLGATLYALLTGRPPFQGETPVETLRKVIEEEPPPLRAFNARVHPDLETICLKCLEKEVEKRYQSAADLAADLNRVLHDEPILARPTSLLEQIKRSGRKHPGRGFAVFTAVVVLLSWYVLGGLSHIGSPEFMTPPLLLVAIALVFVKTRIWTLVASGVAVSLVTGAVMVIRGSALALIVPLFLGILPGFLIGLTGKIVSSRWRKDVLSTILGAFFGYVVGTATVPFLLTSWARARTEFVPQESPTGNPMIRVRPLNDPEMFENALEKLQNALQDSLHKNGKEQIADFVWPFFRFLSTALPSAAAGAVVAAGICKTRD